jgi:hypothetical protein
MAGGGAARPNPKDFVMTPVLRDIHFDFDRYDIRPDDARVLDANAESLKSNPAWRVLIEGHADQRGTTEYNIVLGDRRARVDELSRRPGHPADADRDHQLRRGETRLRPTERILLERESPGALPGKGKVASRKKGAAMSRPRSRLARCSGSIPRPAEPKRLLTRPPRP